MKKRVGVIFGGKSPEHEVSVITGIQVIENLDKEMFDVLPVYIAKDGRWFAGQEFAKIETYSSSLLVYPKNTRKTISLDDHENGLISVEQKNKFFAKESE